MSANAKDEVRALLESWAAALRAKDAAAVTANYTPDVVAFDLDPPLQHSGAGNLRKGFDEWFKTWRGAIGYEITALDIATSGDLAVSRSLNCLSGERTDGSKSDVWFRVTVACRKIGGAWKVFHQHASVPFYMDGSDRAAIDLKP
jgi:PhnB protein